MRMFKKTHKFHQSDLGSFLMKCIYALLFISFEKRSYIRINTLTSRVTTTTTTTTKQFKVKPHKTPSSLRVPSSDHSVSIHQNDLTLNFKPFPSLLLETHINTHTHVRFYTHTQHLKLLLLHIKSIQQSYVIVPILYISASV